MSTQKVIEALGLNSDGSKPASLGGLTVIAKVLAGQTSQDSAVSTLQDSVVTETTARTAADTALGARIDLQVTALGTKVSTSVLGAANGVATLDASGLVTLTQLPSYVDDVIELANLVAFPATGETGKIYVALNTNKTYRWSGSAYIYITSGAVDSVAGKTGVVTLVKGDVGLGNVDDTADSAKPVSTAQATADTAIGTAAATDATTKANAAGAAAQAAAIAASAPIAHVGAGGAAHAAVTTSANGFMLATDKVKLDAVSGTNTGDETLATLKSKLGITTLSGSNTGDQTIPTTLPASDVYAWAKAATKPAYTYSEVGAQAAGSYAATTGATFTGAVNLKTYSESKPSATLTTATAIDCSIGTCFDYTLGAASIALTFSNVPSVANTMFSFTVILRQDATGSRVVTWPTIRWQGGTTPTLTTTANKVDIVSLMTPDGGTTWFGNIAKNY